MRLTPFQTRAQLEQKNVTKFGLPGKNGWLAFEKHYLHQVLATNHDDGVQEDQENDEEITEKEVFEDVQQHLIKEEMQNIKTFDAWL